MIVACSVVASYSLALLVPGNLTFVFIRRTHGPLLLWGALRLAIFIRRLLATARRTHWPDVEQIAAALVDTSCWSAGIVNFEGDKSRQR
jgi:hypothetical protein